MNKCDAQRQRPTDDEAREIERLGRAMRAATMRGAWTRWANGVTFNAADMEGPYGRDDARSRYFLYRWSREGA